MKKLNLFILIIAVALISCERDDICAEGTSTTPRLIIEFYDATSTEDLLNVPRLTIYGDSPDISIPDDEDISSAIVVEPFESSRVYNTNTNNVGLPLLIGNEDEVTTTRFVLERNTNLRLDTDTSTDSNLDIIEISYVPQFEYVSRACGYKSIFTELNITVESDTDNWIDTIEIDEEDVTNENRVHVRIFH